MLIILAFETVGPLDLLLFPQNALAPVLFELLFFCLPLNVTSSSV